MRVQVIVVTSWTEYMLTISALKLNVEQKWPSPGNLKEKISTHPPPPQGSFFENLCTGFIS